MSVEQYIGYYRQFQVYNLVTSLPLKINAFNTNTSYCTAHCLYLCYKFNSLYIRKWQS